jgi:hypothetical protein
MSGQFTNTGATDHWCRFSAGQLIVAHLFKNVLVAEHEDPSMSPQILGTDDYPESIQFNWLKPLFWSQSIGDFVKTTVSISVFS